jgi:phosphopantetheinyl transferase
VFHIFKLRRAKLQNILAIEKHPHNKNILPAILFFQINSYLYGNLCNSKDMPTEKLIHIDSHTNIGIWQITEEIDELMNLARPGNEDLDLLKPIINPQRKKQWLAYRALLNDLNGGKSTRVVYDEQGKPHIPGSHLHISIAHTDEYAACILTSAGRAGVDIEKVKPRIIKVYQKFLSQKEIDFTDAGQQLRKLTLFWCAKEAILKLYGRKHLDFKEQITVSDFDESLSNGTFNVTLNAEDLHGKYKAHFLNHADLEMVWVVEKD